jgi:proteasome assembly chaperone (PAC2) family protein
MQSTVWSDRPVPRNGVMIIAFEGWNDAGDAASGAAQYLANRCDARRFATIDSEAFCDFATTRPHISFDDDGTREITWPDFTLSVGEIHGGDRDLILLEGSEPRLRWRNFCEEVVSVARELEVSMVITLGSLLADVLHDDEAPVYANSNSEELKSAYGMQQSRYEGPTGIIGVLYEATQDAGIPTASLWVPVPSYAPGAPSPKASLALVRHTLMLSQQMLPLTDLEIAAADYERQIGTLVEDDEELQEYIRVLREDRDEQPVDLFGSAGDLVEELEDFLKNQDSPDD